MKDVQTCPDAFTLRRVAIRLVRILVGKQDTEFLVAATTVRLKMKAAGDGRMMTGAICEES